MDALVFIPVLALVLLSLAAAGKTPPRLGAAVLVWGGIIAAAVAIRQWVPDSFFYPKSEIVKRVQGQLRVLRKTADWEKHPVLILEGSSVTLFGVNGAELAGLLAERGLPATVLQFAGAGANHYERLHLLRLFWQSLKPGEREKLRRTRVVLLSEVFDAYDRNPLYLYAREAYSERALVYSTPRNAGEAAQAYRIYQRQPDFAETEPVLWPLLENSLLNTFAVGAFSDLRPPGKLRGIPGFFALTDPKAAFDFPATWTNFAGSWKEPEKFADALPLPQWSRYFETLRAECAPFVDEFGFYALPLLEPQRYAYQRAFADHLPPSVIMIGPPGEAFYSRLNQPGDWFDGTHPRERGAQVFTEWFADELAREWPRLVRPSSP